jgi:hypothetical protein
MDFANRTLTSGKYFSFAHRPLDPPPLVSVSLLAPLLTTSSVTSSVYHVNRAPSQLLALPRAVPHAASRPAATPNIPMSQYHLLPRGRSVC